MNPQEGIPTGKIILLLLRIVAAWLITLIGLSWAIAEWLRQGIGAALGVGVVFFVLYLLAAPRGIRPEHFAMVAREARQELKQRLEHWHETDGIAGGRGPGAGPSQAQRLCWHPAVTVFPFAFLAWKAYMNGFPVKETAGAIFTALWFGLSVFDLISGHLLLHWLYGDDSRDRDG